MWLKVLLFCSLGIFAYADHSPAWRHGYAYNYQVRGRLLTGLNQVSDKYIGIVIKIKLSIQPTQDGHLIGKLSDAQYANLQHWTLHDWEQEIPDSEVSYEELSLEPKPFKILLRDGVVDDLVVDKSISNWQANIIKGVVSQLQLDTAGENQIRSSINIFSQEGSNTAVFKTMEQTVTGETETLYEIHPFPEYILQTEPWWAPLNDKNRRNNLIEVIKSKNFTHNLENPSYHYGFEGVDGFDAENKIGEFLSRTSTSRVILSGTLDSFTIQSAVTAEQITVNPNLKDKQRGLTGSMVNLTLESINEENEQNEEIHNPVNVGLVYRYDQPFAENNEPQPKQKSSGDHSGHQNRRDDISSSESGDASGPEVYVRVQDKPHIQEAPASPLLPFTTGYNGQAISMKQNLKEAVRNIAIKIGKELQEPQNIPKKNTLGKFVILTSVARVMNYNEMKQVAGQLYTQEKEGSAADAWITYRDAVAQAGTGPALLSIQEWIRDKNISGHEAAEIVASAADSARQPTEKYMQVFFGMIENAETMAQNQLNESLLLAYTKLVHKVYVDAEDSHNNYPVHSFGTFNTAQGRLFVKNKVIPHLSSKLNQAISEGDTRNIHLYIRALGNIGHQEILATFKPYLEGTKKASQFQRVLMVIALDKLVKTHPKAARSVLYKIYQNPKDFEQVRVAAVYQLLRSRPTAAMLQNMAIQTNIDTNNFVNSAVKSSIEEAADLQAPRLADVREAAQSAKPFLTAQEFGVQSSKIYLQDYVAEQEQVEIKHKVETIGGEDSVVPKGINYLLKNRFGGMDQQVVNVQSIVSSVDDLVNVWQQQTKEYRGLLKEKQASESIKTKWSSEYAAKLLSVQNEQREQLEGYIFMHINAFQKVYSFDNNSIENISEVVRSFEEELKKGIDVHYRKTSVHPQTAVAFPTAWGLPFLYAYDRPVLMSIQSNVSATAKPSLYSSEGIRRPEIIDSDYEIKGFISGRIQSQFGFFAPFNSRKYSSGYDKNFQLTLPKISGKIHADVEHQQITLEVLKFDKNEHNVLHFSTWPYISQNDIYTDNPQSHIVLEGGQHKVNSVFGDESTGIALSFEMNSDKRIDYGFLHKELQKNKYLPLVLGSWLDDNIQRVEINVGIEPSRTTTSKVSIHLGYQDAYIREQKSPKNILERINHQGPVAAQSWERQNQFLKNSSARISNVHTEVLDAALVFEGPKKIEYTATVSGGRSESDPKGRAIAQVQKLIQGQQIVRLVISAESQTPNPPTLNADSALNFDPTTVIYIKGHLERNQKPKPAEFKARVQLSQSEERKQYLKKQQQYEDCQEQMKEGNNQLPACQAVTAEANLLDKFSVSGNYENFDSSLANRTYKVYSAFRYYVYPRLSENITIPSSHSAKGRFSAEGNYSPDLSAANASVSTEFGRFEVNDLPVNDLARTILVSHPAYDVGSRVAGYVLKHDAYQATCVVDKNAVNTLDNKTYPVSLADDWVVYFHYIPRRPSPIKDQPSLSVTAQLNLHLEGYIVYVRASDQGNSQKEIKMVVQSPHTLSKVIDITLKPSSSSGGYARLFIQNEQVIYDDKGSHIYDDYMQVFKLPNGELKVQVYDSFNLVYDGSRAKISVLDDKFRDATRGLCGTFTGEPETDFTHPGNCILRNPEVFVASNTVSEKQRTKRMMEMLMIQAEEKECYRKSVGYVQVVSARDSGLAGDEKYSGRSQSISKKTKYLYVDGHICFTVEPQPTCPKGTRETSVYKNVPVHCVKQSKNADLFINQIKNGANINFKHKPANRRVNIPVATKCPVYQ